VIREREFEKNVARRGENRILVLFDRFESPNHPPHPVLDVAGDCLKVNGLARGAAHHDRPPSEKADAPKRPATLWSPAVGSAPKYLTSDRNAAEMSAAFTREHSRVWVRAVRVLQHSGGPLGSQPKRIPVQHGYTLGQCQNCL